MTQLINPNTRSIEDVWSAVRAELDRAKATHPGEWNSPHEGYAILAEEVDELWDAVKMRHATREHMAHEAVQVAAMAIRFLENLPNWKTLR